MRLRANAEFVSANTLLLQFAATKHLILSYVTKIMFIKFSFWLHLIEIMLNNINSIYRFRCHSHDKRYFKDPMLIVRPLRALQLSWRKRLDQAHTECKWNWMKQNISQYICLYSAFVPSSIEDTARIFTWLTSVLISGSLESSCAAADAETYLGLIWSPSDGIKFYEKPAWKPAEEQWNYKPFWQYEHFS